MLKGFERHGRLSPLKETVVLIHLLLVDEDIGIDALRLFKCAWMPILGFALQLVGVVGLACVFS